MATILRPYLFSWTDVERSSDLDRFAMLLAAIPDEALVCALEARRGHGRDRYPVRAMWNAVLAGIVMQHPSVASLLRELGRNAELRQICGFDPGQGSAAVPSPWAMSRFVASVVAQRHRIGSSLRQRLVKCCAVRLLQWNLCLMRSHYYC